MGRVSQALADGPELWDTHQPVARPSDLDAGQLLSYVETFRDIFSRAEQVRWFEVYLRGLLITPGRKTVEAIARFVATDGLSASGAMSQSLQHFLTSSQWDEDSLLAEVRAQIPTIGESGSVWVIHDANFLKRGRHSVGVHRQFFRDLQMKAGSQSGVMISQIGPSGYLPLRLRLYLPRTWLSEASERQLSAIPPAFREPIGKPELALRELRKLLAEGRAPKLVVGSDAYSSALEFASKELDVNFQATHNASAVERAERGYASLKDHLGLDHFEGRSWRGWHHHTASVIAAYTFLYQRMPRLCPDAG